jgi:hypothetical protein
MAESTSTTKERYVLCRVCKQRGHSMKIYLRPVIDKDGKVIYKQPYNFYSNTRHFHMMDQEHGLDQGHDFD